MDTMNTGVCVCVCEWLGVSPVALSIRFSFLFKLSSGYLLRCIHTSALQMSQCAVMQCCWLPSFTLWAIIIISIFFGFIHISRAVPFCVERCYSMVFSALCNTINGCWKKITQKLGKKKILEIWFLFMWQQELSFAIETTY